MEVWSQLEGYDVFEVNFLRLTKGIETQQLDLQICWRDLLATVDRGY